MNRKARLFVTLIAATDTGQRLRAVLEFSAVVMIIMTLIALSARGLETYVIRSQLVEAFFVSSTVKAELLAYRAERGAWLPGAAGVFQPYTNPDTELGLSVERLELGDGGVITAVFDRQRAAEGLKGRRLSMRPQVFRAEPGSPVAWVCAAHRVPEGSTVSGDDETDIDPVHLPAACRRY